MKGHTQFPIDFSVISLLIVVSFAGCPTQLVLPAITAQPQSLTVTAGQSVSFVVSAVNVASYQWQQDGVSIVGATAATYSIAAVQASNAGTYVCVVSNGAGSVSSNPATLTVNPAPVAPAITNQPVARIVGPDLPATLSVTATGTPPLSYQWKKDGANISGATNAMFRIAVASAADTGSYVCVVSNSAGSATSNAAALTVLGIQVLSKNGADIATEGLTTKPSSGLRNVAIGDDVYLAAAPPDPAATRAWSIVTKPGGSAPSLLATAGDSTVFSPDKEGTYSVQLTQSAGAKDDIVLSVEISAGTWVGAGVVAKDGSSLSGSQCTYCHVLGGPAPDKVTPWLATGHATMFARAVDGEVSDPGPNDYDQTCVPCHTVGYRTVSTAPDNGFDDVATRLGWSLPPILQAGNWNSLAGASPGLARLGNVQCENCHGPASQHLTNAFSGDVKLDHNLDVGLCGQCHYEVDSILPQWKLSKHADATAQAYLHPAGNTACARCHEGGGYIDFTNGVPEGQRRTNYQVITCTVCHEPHDNAIPHQLRIATVQLPGEAAPRMDEGSSATCMNCHNGRVAPDQITTAANPGFPHHSTAAEMLKGINGITFGVRLQSSFHSSFVKCVDCHMAPPPDLGSPGAYKVGGHTFELRFNKPGDPDDGFQNIQNTCNTATCHQGALTVTDLNRTAFADYDGDGKIDGVQDEVKGLLALVKQQIVAQTGVVALDAYPYWQWSNVPAAKLTLARQAVWNYSLVANDGSYGIHNTEYAVGLLQLTYKQLTGVDIPGAYLRY